MDWNSLFNNNDLYKFVIDASEKTETVDSINELYDELLKGVNYYTCLKVCIIWDFWDERTQTAFAVSKVGEFHASRFLGVMDYWNSKIINKAIKYDVEQRSIARLTQQMETVYDVLEFEILSISEEHNASAISNELVIILDGVAVKVVPYEDENYYDVATKGIKELCRKK